MTDHNYHNVTSGLNFQTQYSFTVTSLSYPPLSLYIYESISDAYFYPEANDVTFAEYIGKIFIYLN